MNHSPRTRHCTRAARIHLQGKICIKVELENGRRLTAKLHSLSVNGGLLELDSYLAERCKVRLTILIGSSQMQPKAEMLFPLWSTNGYLQAFRFEHLWSEERQILETEIAEFLTQTVGRSVLGRRAGLVSPRFFLEST